MSETEPLTLPGVPCVHHTRSGILKRFAACNPPADATAAQANAGG